MKKPLVDPWIHPKNLPMNKLRLKIYMNKCGFILKEQAFHVLNATWWYLKIKSLFYYSHSQFPLVGRVFQTLSAFWSWISSSVWKLPLQYTVPDSNKWNTPCWPPSRKLHRSDWTLGQVDQRKKRTKYRNLKSDIIFSQT